MDNAVHSFFMLHISKKNNIISLLFLFWFSGFDILLENLSVVFTIVVYDILKKSMVSDIKYKPNVIYLKTHL